MMMRLTWAKAAIKGSSCIEEPSCVDVALDLPLLALAALEPEQERVVSEHAARCPWCAQQLAAYTSVEQTLRAYFHMPAEPPRRLTVEDIERARERAEAREAAGTGFPPPAGAPYDIATWVEEDTPFNMPAEPPPWLTVEDTERAYIPQQAARAPLFLPNPLSVSYGPRDTATWAEERDSFSVTQALLRAYAHIRRAPGSVRAYRLAHDEVVAYLDRPMSERQRMRLLFVLGLGHTATEEYDLAIAALDVALDLALRIHDLAAFAECVYLCGAIYDTMTLGSLALEHYAMALEALNRPAWPEHEPVDTAFIMTVQRAHQEANMRHVRSPSLHPETRPSDPTQRSITWLSHHQRSPE